jgi:hypothetical protein
MIRHVILLTIGIILLVQGFVGVKRAKTIGRIPLLTAAIVFLLEPIAGTMVSKNIYLLIAFCAIGASLLIQFFVVDKRREK